MLAYEGRILHILFLNSMTILICDTWRSERVAIKRKETRIKLYISRVYVCTRVNENKKSQISIVFLFIYIKHTRKSHSSVAYK